MRPSSSWSDWSCTVRVAVDDESALPAAVHAVRSQMASVERAASRFSADSDLSRCNSRAGRLTPVSALFVELVQVALAAAEQTGGAVDPTVGTHLAAIGYDDDISVVRARRQAEALFVEDAVALRLPDWTSVRIDTTLGLVGVPAGLALDLGATAKAWTADAAAQTVHALTGKAVMVEIGGDVAVQGADDDPFVIRVAERAGEDGDTVALGHGGLTTSTTTARTWLSPEGRAHHIIDPATGSPARGPWRTATVWADSAVGANTASTAAIVMGERAVPWLSEHAPTARLVGADGRVHHLAGWPATEDVA